MSETGLTTLKQTQIALQNFRFSSVTDEEIQKYKEMYSGAEITGEGPERTASYELVKSNHIKMKKVVSDIESERKEYASIASQIGKQINEEAKRLKGEIEPLLVELESVRKEEEDRKAKIKAEKEKIEQERIDKIKAEISAFEKFCTDTLGNINVSSQIMKEALSTIEYYSTEESFFEEFTPEISIKKDNYIALVSEMIGKKVEQEEREEKIRIEEERQAKIKAEQKAEADRLAKERAEFEAEKKAQADKIQKEEAERERQRVALENEKKLREKAEAEKLQAEENARKAKEQAEKEALEKIDLERIKKEEAEKAEKERKEREERLKPDKDKLSDYFKTIYVVEFPSALDNKISEDLLNDFYTEFDFLADKYRNRIETEL